MEAYRPKSLALNHDAALASRHRREEDAAWQRIREAVDKVLIAYDWGEAFVALHLTVKPVLDAVFNVQLAELARAHEDTLLALMLDEFALDSQQSRDWSAAGRVLRGKIPLGLLKQWVEQWKLLAYRGMEPLVELFGRAPHPQEPHDDSAKVRGADDTFLARCGPEASQT